jgi:hypothetical protein
MLPKLRLAQMRGGRYFSRSPYVFVTLVPASDYLGAARHLFWPRVRSGSEAAVPPTPGTRVVRDQHASVQHLTLQPGIYRIFLSIDATVIAPSYNVGIQMSLKGNPETSGRSLFLFNISDRGDLLGFVGSNRLISVSISNTLLSFQVTNTVQMLRTLEVPACKQGVATAF